MRLFRDSLRNLKKLDNEFLNLINIEYKVEIKVFIFFLILFKKVGRRWKKKKVIRVLLDLVWKNFFRHQLTFL